MPQAEKGGQEAVSHTWSVRKRETNFSSITASFLIYFLHTTITMALKSDVSAPVANTL
jgi:hypothetical protein